MNTEFFRQTESTVWREREKLLAEFKAESRIDTTSLFYNLLFLMYRRDTVWDVILKVGLPMGATTKAANLCPSIKPIFTYESDLSRKKIGTVHELS